MFGARYLLSIFIICSTASVFGVKKNINHVQKKDRTEARAYRAQQAARKTRRSRVDTRLSILEKVENFIAELREVRKEVFGKLNEMRQEFKEHSGDIKEYKEKFDTLSNVLGSPKILEKISGGADKLFTIVVAINKRIEMLEQALKELKEHHLKDVREETMIEKCALCIELQEENEKNSALVRMLEAQLQQHEESINRLMKSADRE